MTTLLHVGLSAFCLFDLGSALVKCKDFFSYSELLNVEKQIF